MTGVPVALGAAAPEPPGRVAMRSELRVTAAGGVAARGDEHAEYERGGIGELPRESVRPKEVRRVGSNCKILQNLVPYADNRIAVGGLTGD